MRATLILFGLVVVFLTAFVNSEVICNYDNSRDCDEGYLEKNTDKKEYFEKEIIILAQEDFLENGKRNEISIRRHGKPIILVLLSKNGIQQYGETYSRWTIFKDDDEVEIEKILTNVNNATEAIEFFSFSNEPPIVYDGSLVFNTERFDYSTQESIKRIVNQEQSSEWIAFGYCSVRDQRFIVNDKESCSQENNFFAFDPVVVAVVVVVIVIIVLFILCFIISGIIWCFVASPDVKNKIPKPVEHQEIGLKSKETDNMVDIKKDQIQPSLNQTTVNHQQLQIQMKDSNEIIKEQMIVESAPDQNDMENNVQQL